MKSLTSEIYLIDGNITIFLGAHTEQFKSDVQYSSLLGQLIADSTPDTWLSSYRSALGKSYWTADSFKNSIYPKKSESILDILTTALFDVLQKEQLQEISKALSILAQLPSDSPAYRVFLRRAQREIASSLNEKTRFTVSPLLTIASENKTVFSLQISFETSRAIDITVLDQPLPASVILDNVKTNFCRTRLLEDKYATIRNKVVTKLGSKPQTHLLHILAPNTTN